MKFMLLFVSGDRWSTVSEEERMAMYAQIGEWWSGHSAAGRIVDGAELQGPDTATTVRVGPGGVSLMDGPFLEAKEHIGGFAIVDVKDREEALAMARSWPPAETVEVRPLVEERQAPA